MFKPSSARVPLMLRKLHSNCPGVTSMAFTAEHDGSLEYNHISLGSGNSSFYMYNAFFLYNGLNPQGSMTVRPDF